MDPDEDEPHLEEAWPHLQLIYELLLKFVLTAHLPNDTIAKHLGNNFLNCFIELFDSEDPRERDYLKTILHRIYGKFMVLRPYIKTRIMNLLMRIVHDNESHNGLTELLEILSSITSGLATPLRQEHADFFKRVLIPLHKVKTLTNFNTQLQLCVKNYMEKSNALSVPLILGLLKFWPITCPAKEVIFINECEEILELMGPQVESRFADFGPQLLKRLLLTSQGMHYQAAERALLLLNGDTIQKMVKSNMQKAYPIIVSGLLGGNQKSHWNQTVNTITYSVIRTYMDMDMDRYERLMQTAAADKKNKDAKQREMENRWAAINKRYQVADQEPQFPLNLWKMRPAGFEDTSRYL